MVITLPYQTLSEYFRDFVLGALEKFFPEECPLCGAIVEFFGFRLRLFLDLPLLRGRCRGRPAHHFTFLPLFVSPAKWYGYAAIEEALGFVAQPEFAEPGAAFRVWEEMRVERALDNQQVGPSTSAARRWWEEFGQQHPQRPWLERTLEAGPKIPVRGGVGCFGGCWSDGLPMERLEPPIPAAITAPSSPQFLTPNLGSGFTVTLLRVLRLLGEALLGRSSPPVSFLAMGLWFLESGFRQRCLARFELAGNVVPGPIPDLTFSTIFHRGYPPQPPPPS